MPSKRLKLFVAMAAGLLGTVAVLGPTNATAPVQSIGQKDATTAKEQSLLPTSQAPATAAIARAAKRYSGEGRDFARNYTRQAWVGKKIRGRFDYYAVSV